MEHQIGALAAAGPGRHIDPVDKCGEQLTAVLHHLRISVDQLMQGRNAPAIMLDRPGMG